MLHLVRSYGDHNVAQPRIRRHLPVGYRDLGSGPIVDAPRIYLSEELRVGDHRLLLEVTDRAVGRSRCEKVEDEVEVPEHALCEKDKKALECIWLEQRNERHQVHAFIFGLVDQFPDPAIIVTHPAQRFQMLHHAANHAGHACDGFQNDGAVAIAMREEGIGEKAQQLRDPERNAIGHPLRCVVTRKVAH